MIIAVETYDKKMISEIIKNDDVEGVVLGDLFCNYRMFSNGSEEIKDYMMQLKEANKKVYFQTSCYLTDVFFENTVKKICYWDKQKLIDGVLLQDIGLLSKLGNMKHDFQLIWSFMGLSRNCAVNLLHYEFLQSLDTVSIATDNPKHCKILQEHGIPTIFMYGRIAYNTVNRLCYYTYENNIYGTDCMRACLKENQHMVNERFNIDMSVDGYMLGKKYVYTESEEYPELLYAQTYEECLNIIKRFKERGLVQ